MSHPVMPNKQSHTRAGRTLLVKPTTNTFTNNVFNNLSGLQNQHFTEKTNSYFLTFVSSNDALSALKFLKHTYEKNVRVKFANYRVFFKLEGLNNEMQYDHIKTAHLQLVPNTLYYRLYRKNNQYLNSGEMTVDTKEDFDMLMNDKHTHSFTVNNMNVNVKHYRYRKSQPSLQPSVSTSS